MNIFIPLVLVCYMGSGCVTGYHYQAEFDTYDECVSFIMDGWKEDVISSLSKQGIPFSYEFNCGEFNPNEFKTKLETKV